MTESWLWVNGQAAGPYSEMAILRMAAKGDANGSTLYWHDAAQEWRPLTRFRDDSHADEIRAIRSHGFPRVEFLAGRTEEECPICQALHGRRFLLGEAPTIPPEGCTCEPWSLARLIGHH